MPTVAVTEFTDGSRSPPSRTGGACAGSSAISSAGAGRPEPEDVTEVLAWAGVPLATMKVAEVCGSSREQAREHLVATGATEEPVGRDAFWTLAA